MNEKNDPCCLRDGEARRVLAGARWRRMVAIGEGRADRRAEPVEGYGSTCWPERVADALRAGEPAVACLNLLSGRVRQAADIRSRQLPQALAFDGDLAVVQLMGRELLRPGFDAGTFRTELVRIIAPLRERGYDVLLVDPFDLTRSPGARQLGHEVVRARQRAQVKHSRTLTLRHGALHVDLSSSGPVGGAGVWDGTGTALNSRGHAVTAAAVVRGLGRRLRPPGPVPDPPAAGGAAGR
ncbi:hypothetical protein LUX12_08115 [Streptomyces somaliensis]|uniref:hypothetical protein n=1 Tax=Streptomyces somaliensis TaxID=78355 RepID=UPI0020CDC364|nr:hypothetical protein [Streptomyces somaliensis]MCP9944752.1 hypothetical protein [Streptomyces somaliensis]MCP9974841.1 hypothetical protein [Streptomyces somaliensis]